MRVFSFEVKTKKGFISSKKPVYHSQSHYSSERTWFTQFYISIYISKITEIDTDMLAKTGLDIF